MKNKLAIIDISTYSDRIMNSSIKYCYIMGNLKKTIIFFIKELIFGGHILSLGGVFVAIMYMKVGNFELNIPIAIGIYFFGQPIFFIDRYVGYKDDIDGNIERTNHIMTYRKYILYFVGLYLLIFVMLMLLVGELSILLLGLSLSIFGSMYGIFIKKITKYIPAFKNIFVALFWAFFGFYILFPDKFDYINTGYVFFGIYIFLRTLSMQIFFDLKDIRSDALMHLKTLPVLFGKRKVLWILNVLNILAFLLVMIGVLRQHFPIQILGLIVIHLISSILYFNISKKLKYHYFIINMFEYTIMLLIILFSYGGII